MADDVVKIIRIETGGSEQTVKGLKEEINSLRDALLNTEKGSEEYKQILEQLIEDQKKLTEVMRAGQKEATAAEGSYNALVNQMAALKKVWRETTDEASRKELGKQIKDINDKLKGFDASVGDFRRNVGDYSNAITTSFGAMGGAAKGMVGPINGVKAAFTALSAHPIVAVLTALAALLINGLVKGFKSSEEATNKLKVAFSGFKAIGDAIMKVFQGIANAIGDLANGIVNLLDKWGLLGSSFKERQAIAQKEIDLQKKQRDNITKNADLEKQAADLRAKAADSSKYTAQERLNFMEQAMKKEEEIANNEYESLKQEYEIIQAKNALADSSAEEKEEEAKAYAAMIKAQTAYVEKTRATTKEMSKLRKEMVRDAQQAELSMLNLQKDLIKQRYDVVEDGSEEQLRLAKELRKKELEIQQVGLKQKIKNRKDYETAMKLSIDAYNKDILILERQHARREAESRQEAYSYALLKGLREGSKEYYTALGDIANRNLVEQQKLGKQEGETDIQFKKRIEGYRKEVHNFYDQAIQASEKETQVINQIILNGTRPMSAYYAKQYEQLKDYFKNMTKLASESDSDFAARQDEAWKKMLDALINMDKAAASELALNDSVFDTLYGRIDGTMSELEDRVQDFKDLYEASLLDIKTFVETDIENISKTLIDKYKDFGEPYKELFGGLIPTQENIKELIGDFDSEEFKTLFSELVKNNLIPEDLMNQYIESLEGMVDAEKSLLKERVDNWSSLASGIGGIMSSVADIYEEDLKAQVEHGQKSEKQAEEEFENIKALRIAVAVIDTIQGALAAFMGWQDKGQPWGAIIGAVQAAAVTAAGIAQIAQISNTKFGGGSHVSAGSTMMAQVTPAFTDYQPEQVGVLTGQQEAEELANAITSKPIRAYVVESDITGAQETATQRSQESTF